MIARYFDPATDSLDSIVTLSSYPKELQVELVKLYRLATFLPENLIVLEHEGELVGQVHIHDSGFPWVVLDGLFIKPEYRGFPAVYTLFKAVYDELIRRGTPLVGAYTNPDLAKSLERNGWVTVSKTLSLLFSPVLPIEQIVTPQENQ